MTVRTKLQHYLSTADFSAEETWSLLRRAQEFKKEPIYRPRHGVAEGRTLAMIFQKPSLRTRVSFETGMTHLGGHAIYLGPDDVQLGRRESSEDIALTLSRMADVILARVFEHAIVEELARFATVPVINALSDLEHPCQVLADLLTIHERKGRLAGVRLAYVGDGNNVAHSLMLGAALMGMKCTIITPPGYAPRPGVLEHAARLARASGGTVRASHEVADVRDADVVYTDVWASMGQEAEAATRRKLFEAYQVNAALLARARPDVTLLHCLPAHYGEEIDYPTSRSAASAIFDQAENRLHAQKALLARLLE